MIFPHYYVLFSQQTVPDASFYESYLIALNSFDHESHADCEKLGLQVLKLKKFLLDLKACSGLNATIMHGLQKNWFVEDSSKKAVTLWNGKINEIKWNQNKINEYLTSNRLSGMIEPQLSVWTYNSWTWTVLCSSKFPLMQLWTRLTHKTHTHTN